jgi:hypothetical protein
MKNGVWDRRGRRFFYQFPPFVEDIVLVGEPEYWQTNGMGALNSAAASIVPSSSRPDITRV